MDHDVVTFRQFSRFFTGIVGTLNDEFLKSRYTLPQARVLYEIAASQRAAAPSAREIEKKLGMDGGYLSRIVASLEKEGLINRAPSKGNAKRLALTLTKKGQREFGSLNEAANQEAELLLQHLSAQERAELAGAMDSIHRLLDDSLSEKTFILREPEPGDLGYIIQQQARLYAKEYGWDWTYEALVADIVSTFINNYNKSRERCWVAVMDGHIVGSVFVVQENASTAKLRLLYVEQRARGLGLGQTLVEECIRFSKSKGYERLVLWTNSVLVSARKIYEANGFKLTNEEAHHSFGQDLVGQEWELGL